MRESKNIMEDANMGNKVMHRVDVQVALLVVILVTISSVATYYLVYTMSYKETIRELEQEVIAIEEKVEKELDSKVFNEIDSKEDMTGELYQEAYEFLSTARETSGAKYLYIATRNKDGELIYHIDGLAADDPDFRNVGDLIEPEFQEPLIQALNNEIVMPGDILDTEWGHVFVAYFPLTNEEGEVVAAIGVEFPADSQVAAYDKIRFNVGIFIVIMCIVSGTLARIFFKRISNPYFKDIYNTDSLTGLKNRNAFDMDIQNAIQRKRVSGATLILTDLNGLKNVNDELGHKVGDFYIETCAKALVVEGMKECIPYRIGGDEFATIIPRGKEVKPEDYIEAVKKNIETLCKGKIENAAVAMGYAVCEDVNLEAWEETQRKADKEMYKDKRAFYENNKELDKRRK